MGYKKYYQYDFNKSKLMESLVKLIVYTSICVFSYVLLFHERDLLNIFILLLESYIFVFSTYFTVLTIFGWSKYKRNYKIQQPKTKFLIIVPAHNEEKVVSGICDNLQKDINYPRELYDFYIIADNCTDKTAEIARQHGAKVFENFSKPEDPRGKPYAIKAFLDWIGDEIYKYDVLTIFDSDNIVHPEYFNEINSQFQTYKDTDLIQCRVLSKNPDDNYISGGYALSESFMNRFYTIPKQKLGINTTIQGTGFNVRIPYLKEVGWNPKSITEDFEFQVEMALLGKKSQFNAFAYIYDEKPITTKVSLIQRLRWSRGHWNVALSNFKKIMLNLIKHPSLTAFDTFIYSYNMSRTLILVLSMLLSVFALIQNTILGKDVVIFNIYSNPIISILNVVYNLAVFYTAYKEQVTQKRWKALFYFFYSYVWFTVTYIPLHIIALMTYKVQKWKRTEKFINITLDQRLNNNSQNTNLIKTDNNIINTNI